MTADTSQRFELRDGQKPIYVEGWLIADADSQTGNDPRWTELTLYRTLTGKYVLEKIGRSDVFHSARCSRKSKGVMHEDLPDAADAKDVDEDAFVQCRDCRPQRDETPVFVERDISAVAVYPSADGLVEALFRRDSDNMRYLSRVARALLETAAVNDDEIGRVVSAPATIT